MKQNVRGSPFLTSGDLDLWPFELIIGTPATSALENVHAGLVYTFFLFSS